MMAFQPAGNVDQQRKAGGVRLRKSVFTEALYLLVKPLGELFVVAIGAHAIDELVAEFIEPAFAFPGGHGATQFIGFARRKAGRHHCQLHHLFLKNRHAQRTCQHRFHRLARIDHGFFTVAAFQVRMHHAALNRPRSHDRHLDHQIVIAFRFQARQHAHLRARFNLEYADGVGTLDHLIGGGVFAGNILHGHRQAAPAANEIQRFANRGEHAQRQHIDFQ